MIASAALSDTMRSEMKRIISNIELAKSDTNAKNRAASLPNLYNITLVFTSKINPMVNVKLSREVKTVTIEQDYVNNITDKITAELEISVNTFEILQQFRSELFCELSFTPSDFTHGPIKQFTPVFCRQFRAVLLNTQDIYKSISGRKLRPKDYNKTAEVTDVAHLTLPLKLELIDDTVYSARHDRIHGVFGEVNMINMLRHIVSDFGIPKAAIKMPDNSYFYTNLVIPPDFGIADIMGFMQNGPGMGVYNNGFCSYITDGTWYIYPRYGEGWSKRVVQLYSLGKDTIAGLNKFDWKEVLSDESDWVTHILLNSDVVENNWSLLGVENTPNAANIQSADLLIDGTRKWIKDDTFHMRPVASPTVFVPSDVMSAEKSINMTFKTSQANDFTITSELCATQASTLAFRWEACSPFTFTPGTEVKFNYDHPGGYKSVSCKCEQVTYKFIQSTTHNLYPVFGGVADVVLVYNNFDALVGET